MLTMLCWVLTSILLATLSSLGGCKASTCSNSNCRSAPQCNDQQDSSDHNSILRKILRGYDHHLIPTFGKGKQTQVVCDVYINSFDSISVDTMDYQVDIYMRQRWTDPRLAYGHLDMNISRLSLDHRMYHSIWVPDLFFPNEKSSHVHCVTVPNSMIRIYPDGSILYSARYTLRLACHMTLQRFPLDTQTCHMKIESYGYTQDEILLSWLNESNVDSVQINDDLELPQFDLERHTWGICNDSYIIGSFACLEATFNLRRQYGYYMIQTYVPSILIVTLSWTSFWINMDAIPARISLGVLTVLTLTTQCVGVWMSLPRVSYIKAIDVWMAMCIISVFSAMLEFAIVNTLSRKELRRITIRAAAQSKDPHTATDNLKRMIEEYNYGRAKPLDGGKRMLARRVDKVARWLFPIAFLIFNVIYWSYYLS